VAGTFVGPVDELARLSRHNVIPFYLRPLVLAEAIRVVASAWNWCRLPARQSPALLVVLQLIGGHPRALEALYDVLKRPASGELPKCLHYYLHQHLHVVALQSWLTRLTRLKSIEIRQRECLASCHVPVRAN
jgi:hypothetical protein